MIHCKNHFINMF